MTVGILSVRIVIRDSHSLKDKRQVINSLKDRIRQRFNVSLSEMGSQDNHQQCLMGIAMVGNDGKYVNSTLSILVNFFRSFPKVELVDYNLELM